MYVTVHTYICVMSIVSMCVHSCTDTLYLYLYVAIARHQLNAMTGSIAEAVFVIVAVYY